MTDFVGLSLEHVRDWMRSHVRIVPSGVRAVRDLVYVPGGGRRQSLDLYLPAGSRAAPPIVLWIHGGAWLTGNKEHPPALYLCRRGYAVAAINYRLSREAVFPAQIMDCRAAVRWLRAHARMYGADPTRIGVWGVSAGAHLAALLGTANRVSAWDALGADRQESCAVQAVCDWFGPTDFLQMGGRHDRPGSPESLLVGGPIQEHRDRVAAANPIAYVTDAAPPFLIIHGEKDDLVPLNQSELLHAALRRAGVESDLHVIPGAGHGKGVYTDANMLLVREFMDRHLQRGAQPAGD